MKRVKIKYNKNAFGFFYALYFNNSNIVMTCTFTIIALALLIMDYNNITNIVNIKNKVQSIALSSTSSFDYFTLKLNRNLLRLKTEETTQYDNFIYDSYLEGADFRRLLEENNRLKLLLKFIEDNNWQQKGFITTRVFFNAGDTHAFIKIGHRHGIKLNQLIVNEKGVLGKIVNVQEAYSKLLFVTDINCRIVAKTTESDYISIVAGDGKGLLDILYIPDEGGLKSGEFVVTAPNMNFPSDVKIGIVTAQGKVSPMINFNHIDTVSIVID